MLARSTKLATILTLCGLLSSATAVAQSPVVVLGAANGCQDVIEDSVTVGRQLNGERCRNPLTGTNLLFSCGSCDVADFTDPKNTTQTIGGSGFLGNPGLCGYDVNVPEQIVENDDKVCAASQLSGTKYDIDRLSWQTGNGNCSDADGGHACTAAEGLTSFTRQVFGSVDVMLMDLINKIINVNIEEHIGNAFDPKIIFALKAIDALKQSERVAVKRLQLFTRTVEFQSRWKIDMTTANELTADAQAIIDRIDPDGELRNSHFPFRHGSLR